MDIVGVQNRNLYIQYIFKGNINNIICVFIYLLVFEEKEPFQKFEGNPSTGATHCVLLLLFFSVSCLCWKSPKKLSPRTVLPSIRSFQPPKGSSVMYSFPWQAKGGRELQELRRRRGQQDTDRQHASDVLLASSYREESTGFKDNRMTKENVRWEKYLVVFSVNV